MRPFILCLLVLVALSGVAVADRGAPHVRDHRGGVYVQPHSQVQPRTRYQYRSPARYVVRPSVRVVRRPIYVQRPSIAVRYYNHHQRPALIAENYAPMTGYVWIPGHWDWNGYEWIWNPGHYEPDPSYGAPDHYHTAPRSYGGSYHDGGSHHDSGSYYNGSYYNSGGYDDSYYN